MNTPNLTTNDTPPDQSGIDHNLRRALWALAIIDAYAKEHGTSRAEAFPEVITNFMHAADHEKRDFDDDIVEKAKVHHDEEVEGEGAI